METSQELGQGCTEMAQVCGWLTNILKERALHNTDLYTAMLKLTESEFNRTYTSLERDPSGQMRHKLAQPRCYRKANCDIHPMLYLQF